jgi:hypothetical protein
LFTLRRPVATDAYFDGYTYCIKNINKSAGNLAQQMEFIDLKRQYQEVRGDVEAGIKAVPSGGNYILGPEVSDLENRLAEFGVPPGAPPVCADTGQKTFNMDVAGSVPGMYCLSSSLYCIASFDTLVPPGYEQCKYLFPLGSCLPRNRLVKKSPKCHSLNYTLSKKVAYSEDVSAVRCRF